VKHAALLLLFLLPACNPAPVAWREVSPADLDTADRERLETARTTVAALGTRLMGELLAAETEGGAKQAIEVCGKVAPEIAREVAGRLGGRIGRTSHRLRNPENAPPDWIADLMAEEPRVYLGPDGEMGVTLPIPTKAMCLTCHGAPEGELLAKIDELYPDDKARGFAEGDLRGQFFVELPASSR
jgi:Protein of unknown function (DUF3365)